MLLIGVSYDFKVGNNEPGQTYNGIYIGKSINSFGAEHYVFAMSEKSTFGVLYDNLSLDIGDPILDIINYYYNGKPLKTVKFYLRKQEDIISITSLKNKCIIELIAFYV